MKRKNILKEAGVLLIAVIMVLSTTVVTASLTNNTIKAVTSSDSLLGLTKLVDPSTEATPLAHFGYSVSMSTHYAVVGEPGDDYYGTDAGTAVVYIRDGDSWKVQRKLYAENPKPGDKFGWSVSNTDSYILIGAPYDDTKGTDAGAAFVFNIPSGYTRTPLYDTYSEHPPNGLFGYSVSISNTYAIIGEPGDDTYNQANAGRAEVFIRSGTDWNHPQTFLYATTTHVGDTFGWSVSNTDKYILIGAPNYEPTTITDAGAAFAFNIIKDYARKEVTDVFDPSPSGHFGFSVSISATYAVIGEPGDDYDHAVGANVGRAEVYQIQETESDWILDPQVKLYATHSHAGDMFGWSVSNTDSYILIGAPYDDAKGTDAGSACVFTIGNYIKNKLMADDEVANDNFGYSVKINGNNMLIGAPYDDDTTKGTDAGAVYYGEANVKDDETSPTCECVKPLQYWIYIVDVKSLQIDSISAAIGHITIQVEASDAETGIDHVDIILNGLTYIGVVNAGRYEYVLSTTTSFIPVAINLKTVAWDMAGNSRTCCEFSFWYWNPFGV